MNKKQLIKALKPLEVIATAAMLLLLMWAAASYVDVVVHNLHDPHYDNWNLWQLLINWANSR